ncbi:MAG: nucleotidyltransferase domain-containing protein [Armatimonadota bacterium]
MLEAIIQSKTRIDLLKIFLLGDNRRFYLRELVAKTGLAQGSVQRELAQLLKAGILTKETSGRQTYYQLDPLCPIIPELRSIFIKTVGVVDAIKEALQPEIKSIRTAFIFGSFATGEVRPESDIDLFIIGSITLRKLTSLLKSANVSRVINPIVMSEDEFNFRKNEDDHFITSLINSPKLFLIGDENGL